MAHNDESGSGDKSHTVINQWSKPSVILTGLPVFSGKSGENVREFFTKIAQRARIDGWSEKQTVGVIKYQLSGEAFELAETEDLFRDEDTTYEELEKFLLNKYQKKIVPGSGLLRISRCYQNARESILDYASRLKIVGRDLYRENLELIDVENKAELDATKRRHDLDLTSQFQKGINPEIAKIVIFELHRNARASFDEVVTLAQQAETSYDMLNLNKRTNEWRVNEMHPREESANREFNDRQNIQCYKCRKYGHTANKCRSKGDMRCYNCNKIGHKQYECRQAIRRSENRNVRANNTNIRERKSLNENRSC